MTTRSGQILWRLLSPLFALLLVAGGLVTAVAPAAAADGYDISGMNQTMQQAAGSNPAGTLVCAVWTQFDVAEPQVYFRLYNTASGTWTPTAQVSSVSGTNNPRCTIDTAGRAHVVWQAQNTVYHRVSDEQGTWGPPAQPVISGRSSSDIDASPTGGVWLVYRHWYGDNAANDLELRVWNGAWSGPFIYNTGGAADAPRIGVDNTGRVHIVFKNGNNTGGVSYISFAGGAFGQRLTVPGGTNTGSADIAVNRDTGEAHAVYVKDWVNIYHFTVAPGATSFAGGLIASGSVQVDDPTIAWLGGQHFVLTFNNNKGSSVDRTDSMDGGANWSAAAKLASIGGTSAPWVANGAGDGYVVYNRRSEGRVYFTTTNSGTETPPPPSQQRFSDVPSSYKYATAIDYLADRGIIRGYGDGRFGPNDNTLRAQMAAMIARAVGWDGEAHDNPFTDQGPVDFFLWQNVGTLAYYDVARGYTPQGCSNIGAAYPCFGSVDKVLYVQSISFITRAMVAKGYWVPETGDNPALYPNVGWDTGHRQDLLTYYKYVGGIPETTPTANWDKWSAAATRGWFAQALYLALQAPR